MRHLPLRPAAPLERHAREASHLVWSRLRRCVRRDGENAVRDRGRAHGAIRKEGACLTGQTALRPQAVSTSFTATRNVDAPSAHGACTAISGASGWPSPTSEPQSAASAGTASGAKAKTASVIRRSTRSRTSTRGLGYDADVHLHEHVQRDRVRRPVQGLQRLRRLDHRSPRHAWPTARDAMRARPRLPRCVPVLGACRWLSMSGNVRACSSRRTGCGAVRVSCDARQKAANRRFPPASISIRFCPVCGRDDRFQPFTGKSHFAMGDRCSGTPVDVLYSRSAG